MWSIDEARETLRGEMPKGAQWYFTAYVQDGWDGKWTRVSGDVRVLRAGGYEIFRFTSDPAPAVEAALAKAREWQLVEEGENDAD